MKKIVLLVLTILLVGTMPSFAVGDQYLDYAEKLKEIGVFKGTGNGFELNRPPTRLEGAVMFIRLLGAEQEALEKNYSHPFVDVPTWGNPYVGYMYQHGLTKGISATEFGAANIMDAKSYLTFMLRALNYDDSKGDFSWELAVEKSIKIGLLEEQLFNDLKKNQFSRGHVAIISYKTLKQNMNMSDESLADKLINDGAFSEETAISMGVIDNQTSNIFAKGSPLSFFTEKEIIDLGANGFTGTDYEIATKIKEWQVENMIYAGSNKKYKDLSYSMRWNYAFPGIYTTRDMIENMRDGDKIYGICYNYATIFAEIANYYGLEVRVTNTTVKPSEVSKNPFYDATAAGMSPDEYAAFKKWIIAKGLNEEDYPYGAVRLVMGETALHYRAEVKIDNEWIPFDTYRKENSAANKYSFVETNWQEGNQEEKFKEYVQRIKNGENLKGDETLSQTYTAFLEGRLIRIEQNELENYKGITDDLGQNKRAANQEDLFQGYGLVPYFNDKKDVLEFMGNLDWLEEEIDEYFELKERIENDTDHNLYVIAIIMLTPEDGEEISYELLAEQYAGYTGENISKEIFDKYIKPAL